MSVKHIKHGLIMIGLAILLISCSESNPEAPLAGSFHNSSWVVEHGTFAVADPFECTTCHGADYNGGVGVPSCFSCHYDGPPFAIHPSTWADAYIDHRPFVIANGTASCSLSACHGTQPFVAGGLTGPSCSTATYTDRDGITLGCHTGGHISGDVWVLPSAHAASAISNLASCLVCHAMTAPSPVPLAPACQDCHQASTPQMVLGTCSSCHNDPPDGNTFPNRDGEHDKHVNGEGYGCATCHQGFGTDTLGHWYPNPADPADIQFEGGVNIVFNGSTCTGDCHGKDHNFSW